MDKFINKFSTYEILGYFIPGILFSILLSVLYKSLGIKIPINFNNIFMLSLIMLVISYFLGVLTHELSEIIQLKLIKDWKGFPSQRILTKSDTSMIKNPKEKQDYYSIAKIDFDIDVDQDSKDDSDLVFHRFRSALMKNNKAQNTEIFNAQYGLYRNFLAISLVCFVIFYFLMIKNAFSGMHFANNSFYITHMFLFFIASLLFIRRTRRFGETYVKSVFRTYYELHKEKNKPAPQFTIGNRES